MGGPATRTPPPTSAAAPGPRRRARQPRSLRALADRAADAARRTERDLATTVLGTTRPAPVMLAPIGVQGIVHPKASWEARAPRRGGMPSSSASASHSRSRRSPRRPGDGAALVPALLADDRELGAELRRARRGRRLRGDRRHGRHLHARLEAARPRAGLSARSSQGKGIANYSSDPVFMGALAQAADEDPAPPRPLRRGPPQPALTWGGPRLAARDDVAADPAQGDPAPRRCARGGRRAASTGWSSPTTAGARSTARSPPSTPCRTIADGGGRASSPVLLRQRRPQWHRRVKALALGAEAVLLGRPYI